MSGAPMETSPSPTPVASRPASATSMRAVDEDNDAAAAASAHAQYSPVIPAPRDTADDESGGHGRDDDDEDDGAEEYEAEETAEFDEEDEEQSLADEQEAARLDELDRQAAQAGGGDQVVESATSAQQAAPASAQPTPADAAAPAVAPSAEQSASTAAASSIAATSSTAAPASSSSGPASASAAGAPSSASAATASGAPASSAAPAAAATPESKQALRDRSYQIAVKRLLADARQMESDPPEGVSGGPLDPSAPFVWRCSVFGPAGTVWEGGVFQLQMQFGVDYPSKPPTVKFTSSIFHPNVFADGALCLDIIQDKWSPVHSVSSILTSIQSLLDDPNNASPANPEAAKMLATDQKQYPDGDGDSGPSMWSRLRSSCSTASAGRTLASTGLLGSVPAPSAHTEGEHRFEQGNHSGARQGNHWHGKQRDSMELEADTILAEKEEADLKEQYQQMPLPTASADEPELSPISEDVHIGGPRFHEEEHSEAKVDKPEEERKVPSSHGGIGDGGKKVDPNNPDQRAFAATLASVANKTTSGLSAYESSAAEDPELRRRRRLDAISDPDIRAVLDPHSTDFHSEQQILAWPDSKIIALVQAFDFADMEGLLHKIREGTLQGMGAEERMAEGALTSALSWRNLSYSIDGTMMLQNVSGYVRPGTLTAVLGGPDAGCTTLLEVLAQRTKGRGQLLGDVFLNRRPIDATFARQVGYVSKRDVHLPQLTVSETLYFSARLRNPSLSQRAAILRVALVMKLLGLLHTWNTPLGDDILRGVSGGEKRRVSFGLELVAGHNLVLADLPTNGLDSGSALSLIQVYKSVTLIGRSLLCSLVQPSPAIYALLDFVLVLSKGATIYFGPGDLAVRHFASLGFTKPAAKSVPQFLEEISAAPERFWTGAPLSKDLASDPLTAGMHTQRPLEMLREREERIKRSRARLMSSSSFVGEHAGVMEGSKQLPPGAGSSWPSAHVVIEMAHQSVPLTARSSVASGLSSPVVASAALAADDDEEDLSSHARLNAWRSLVSGFSASVFSDDVGYVLHHDLTPEPVFKETELKGARAKARKAAAARAKRKAEEALNAKKQDGVHGTAKGPSAASAASKPSKPSPHARHADANVTSWGTQYQENLNRMVVLFYRNRALWLLNFLKSIGIGLLIGTLFYMLSLSQENVRTRFGLYYFMLTFNTANAQQLVPVLLSFRRVFQLQKESHYYRPSTYYLALCTVNIPIAAFETFLFLIIVYPLAGLHGGINSSRFGYAYFMLLLLNLVSRSWVILLAAVTPTEALMNILNGVSTVIFSIFSGYLNPKASIPRGWIWAYFISFYTWALRGLMINEQEGLVYDCGPAGTPCLYPTGEAALALYDMRPSSGNANEKWMCILWMSLFLVAFNILASWAMNAIDTGGTDHEEEPDFEPAEIEPTQSRKMLGDGKAISDGAALVSSQKLMTDGTEVAASAAPDSFGDGAAATHAPVTSAKDSAESLLPHHDAAASGVTGGYISWRDLEYSVKLDDGSERTLLNKVVGYAAPGMLVALMGASGAGKTTLLDVLAGKKTGGTIKGELLVNGLPRDASFMRIAGYVEQFDSHNEKSSVREAVRFSAMMRLPKAVTDDSAEVERRVSKVLAQLGLTRIQHDLIGNSMMGGISQEARKKVTIAVELIGEPKILCLDEPTTGLDSAAALGVMECISGLSNHMSVLCTIHQPSQELISYFSHLCLLQPGGRTVYFGTLKDMPLHFKEAGLPRYKPGENLADYAITCAKTTMLRSGEKIDLRQRFEQSPLGQQLADTLKRGVANESVRAAWTHERLTLAPHGHNGPLAPFVLQFKELLRRFVATLLRSPDIWFGRIFAQLMMGFIIGTCYFRLGHDQSASQNRVSCLFLTVQFVMGSGALKLPAIFAERAVVFRERQAQMYSPSAYYLARWFHDWGLWLVENMLFALMVYFIVSRECSISDCGAARKSCECNLNTADSGARFGAFYLLLLLTAQLGFALSELVALVSPTPATSYALQGGVATVFSLFSGFLISHANMPSAWAWAWYVSPNRYPLTASLQNEMLGQGFSCDQSVKFPGAAPLCGLEDASALRCPLTCGDELLKSLDIPPTSEDMIQNFGLIAVYVAGFKILGFIAFKYLMHIRR